MLYGINQIIEDVKVAIDEIAANDASYAGTQDNAEMDSIIRSKVEESADYVHSFCLSGLLSDDECDNVDYAGNAVVPNPVVYPVVTSDGKSEVDSGMVLRVKLKAESLATGDTDKSLKLDVLRLVYADVYGEWPYPVGAMVSSTDSEYAEISDYYVGASYERPAVALSHQRVSSGSIYQVMEFRTLHSVSDVAHASVVCRSVLGYYNNDGTPASSGTEKKIKVNSPLYEAFVYRVAGLVEMTYKEELGSTLLEMCDRLIGLREKQ